MNSQVSDEIVSFIAIYSVRSCAVMERMGMHNAQQDFEHRALRQGHPLRLHYPHRWHREQWQATMDAQSLLTAKTFF